MPASTHPGGPPPSPGEMPYQGVVRVFAALPPWQLMLATAARSIGRAHLTAVWAEDTPPTLDTDLAAELFTTRTAFDLQIETAGGDLPVAVPSARLVHASRRGARQSDWHLHFAYEPLGAADWAVLDPGR